MKQYRETADEMKGGNVPCCGSYTRRGVMVGSKLALLLLVDFHMV